MLLRPHEGAPHVLVPSGRVVLARRHGHDFDQPGKRRHVGEVGQRHVERQQRRSRGFDPGPHPNPLPGGEGGQSSVPVVCKRLEFSGVSARSRTISHTGSLGCAGTVSASDLGQGAVKVGHGNGGRQFDPHRLATAHGEAAETDLVAEASIVAVRVAAFIGADRDFPPPIPSQREREVGRPRRAPCGGCTAPRWRGPPGARRPRPR